VAVVVVVVAVVVALMVGGGGGGRLIGVGAVFVCFGSRGLARAAGGTSYSIDCMYPWPNGLSGCASRHYFREVVGSTPSGVVFFCS